MIAAMSNFESELLEQQKSSPKPRAAKSRDLV
jgi:hypothetical protein